MTKDKSMEYAIKKLKRKIPTLVLIILTLLFGVIYGIVTM